MKLVKSYTAKITGNADKESKLLFNLSILQQVSEYVFPLGFDYWFDFKTMYHDCRERFPELNSKILQNFLQKYRPIKGKKSPKKVISSNIILDNQNFNMLFDPDTKYTNYWLRFGRRNYPLRGKRILSRIKDVSGVQECRIFSRNNNLYCKLTYVEEIPEITADPAKSVGIDFNTKRLASSNNKIYKMDRWFHRKSEYKKNKGKKNINNYTKNFVHSLANSIIEDLIFTGQEVLVLENLTDLRKSSSKKNGTSKGKTVNYMINNCFPFSMLKQILEYKCLESNILVETVSPAFTSKTCSRCGSQETIRESQPRFKCQDCGFQLDADLNASRNIKSRYTSLNGLPVNPARLCSQRQAAHLNA